MSWRLKIFYNPKRLVKVTLSVKDIKSIPKYIARAQQRGRRYAVLMKRGVKLPSILVYFNGHQYWIKDGNARLVAYKILGVQKVEARIVNSIAH